jgi:hypothetical protein
MKKAEFRIHFDMPIRGSDITIPMTAMAELHHSEPHYVLRSVEIITDHPAGEKKTAFVKELKIKRVKEGAENIWVHCDTGRESELSRSAGIAIEQLRGAET